VMGLETRTRAQAALGRRKEAVRDARSAVRMSRSLGDPALFLRAATALLALEGDELLLRETRQTAGRILAELPDAEMRRQFEMAESVRLLGPLA